MVKVVISTVSAVNKKQFAFFNYHVKLYTVSVDKVLSFGQAISDNNKQMITKTD